MGDDILRIAKNVTSFFGLDGYPTTAATTEDDLKKKFNALLKQAKEDKIKPIELNAENLIEMLDIAAATPAVPAVPGGAAATPVVPGGAISTIVGGASLDQAKLIARVLNNALTNDNYKAKTIAATLKERGVALKDAAAALNQKGLRLDSKGKFDALQELYNDETDIDIAVAVAWVGLSPGTAGGPAAATDYNSLNKRLEELKATGIKLTPENLIEMLDIAATTPAVPAVGGAATPAVPGGAIKTIASTPGDQVKLISKVLNDFLVDKNNRHEIISEILDKKTLDLKNIDINLPPLYETSRELQNAGGFQKLYKDAVDDNHITKVNIHQFTAALVKRRRDQNVKRYRGWGPEFRGGTHINQNNFVDMMVITCKEYQEKKGASDEDVKEMLGSFANQYGGYWYDNASQSNKNTILEQAANLLYKDDKEKTQKVKGILSSFNPRYGNKKPSSSPEGKKYDGQQPSGRIEYVKVGDIRPGSKGLG